MKIELADAYPILEKLMSEDRLTIFAGSGISKLSGLPDWNGLIHEFIDMIEKIKINEMKDKGDLEVIIKDAKNRFANNRFNAIEIATVLKNRLKKCEELYNENTLAYRDYRNWISKMFSQKTPNLLHKLIVKTNYPFILTSNYDTLFEDIAYDESFFDIASNIYTFKDQLEIMSAIYNGRKCIIHVHGTATTLSIDELIFTKEDYNKIILKKYEGFSFALRILFTRYSTLFVGYGASDPHLEEVLEELADFFPLEDKTFTLPESYLVTLRDKADSIMEAYKNRVRTNLILIDDFSQYENLLLHLQNKNPR